MENINDISVKDALGRLSLPVFYTDEERMTAYFVIMEKGNMIDKVIAEKIVGVYPLEEYLQLRMEEAA